MTSSVDDLYVVIAVRDHDVQAALSRFCYARIGARTILWSANAPIPALVRGPVILVLDEALAGDGLGQICSALRSNAPTRIIVRGARDSGEQPAMSAIEAGADQYVAERDSLDMLQASVLSWFRNVRATSPSLNIGPLAVDLAGLKATLDGRRLMLRPAAFRLLAELARFSPAPVDAQRLLDVVCNGHGDPRKNLKPHVCSVRVELREHAKMVRTIRHVGYALRLN